MGFKVLTTSGATKQGTVPTNDLAQAIGTLVVANGGTGATTLTGILRGTGTTAIAVTAIPSDATQFLNGAATPAYALVKDSDLSTTDITTNNVTTAKHGFTPKLSNVATQYLDGTGAYSTPAGSSVIQRALVNITDAQCRALDTVPIVLVAAQGANTIILPLKLDILWNIPTTVFSTTRIVNVRPTGGATSYFTALTLGTNSTGNKINASALSLAIANSNVDTLVAVNTAVEIFATIAATSGVTTGGFNVYLSYHVLTTV